MRITFVLPYAGLAGGIRVVAIYADRLTRRGHDVVVVSTPKSEPSLKQKAKSLLKGRGWPKVEQGGPSHFDGLDVPHRVLDRFRPVTDADVPDADVVVATWWETAEWVSSLCASKGAKAYFIQGNEPQFAYAPGGPDQVKATWILPTHKITLSCGLGELLLSSYQQQADVVLNSVDTSQFFADPRGKQHVPTVGVLYSAHPVKGFDLSAITIGIVRKNLPQTRVIAFGAELPTVVCPLPGGTDYARRPPQHLIPSLYSQCDVWLCASRNEGFHLPPLEAMACRCPVVSSRVGGPVDIIRDGENGFLLDVGDTEGMAAQVLKVLQMPDNQWRAMSDAAYATAIRYTWDDATVLFEKALEHAVQRAGRGEIAGGVREIANG